MMCETHRLWKKTPSQKSLYFKISSWTACVLFDVLSNEIENILFYNLKVFIVTPRPTTEHVEVQCVIGQKLIVLIVSFIFKHSHLKPKQHSLHSKHVIIHTITFKYI